MRWIIWDWAGNRPFGNMEFDSWETAWEYIYANVDSSEFDQTQNENDNVHQEYYVIEKD